MNLIRDQVSPGIPLITAPNRKAIQRAVPEPDAVWLKDL